jgi:hypothetical protein
LTRVMEYLPSMSEALSSSSSEREREEEKFLSIYS